MNAIRPPELASGLFISLFFIALLVALPATSRANRAQWHICAAGMNLGQAESRVFLFGRAFGDEIPPDQLAAIATNLSNAAAHIGAAESLFDEPFSTERSRQGVAAARIAEITNYATLTPGWSIRHRANYIMNIYSKYRQGLSYTFVNSRPDAFQYKPNCDSLILDACYQYGKATTASAFEGHFERGYQSGANGLMRTAIDDGLAIAMDPGAKPFDGHRKKICCSFGTPSEWAMLPVFQPNSPHPLYATHQTTVLDIVGNSNVAPGVCSPAHARCASSPDQRTPTHLPNLAGQWICKTNCPAGGEGRPASIEQNGSQLSFTNEGGGRSQGRFLNSNTIIATQWGNLRGTIDSNGNIIRWSNGTVWIHR